MPIVNLRADTASCAAPWRSGTTIPLHASRAGPPPFTDASPEGRPAAVEAIRQWLQREVNEPCIHSASAPPPLRETRRRQARVMLRAFAAQLCTLTTTLALLSMTECATVQAVALGVPPTAREAAVERAPGGRVARVQRCEIFYGHPASAVRASLPDIVRRYNEAGWEISAVSGNALQGGAICFQQPAAAPVQSAMVSTSATQPSGG